MSNESGGQKSVDRVTSAVLSGGLPLRFHGPDIIPPQRKWTVISWESRGELPDGDLIPMDCPHCHRWAWMPTAGHPGALVITTFSLRIVFDPPDHEPPVGWMPDEIKCAKCRRVWSSKRAGEA